MKLHQAILQEVNGSVSYMMILDEIIAAGDVTNDAQIFVLALVSQFFKDGGNYDIDTQLGGLVPLSNDATTTRVVESIKSLTPSDKVNLAQYLKDCIAVGKSVLHDPTMSSSDWIRFVLRSQG